MHKKYYRLLSAPEMQDRLEAVRYLIVSKPSESRHAHLRSLPIENMTHITHLYTYSLCLAEIEYLCSQIVKSSQSTLRSISCRDIETWCDTKRFTFEMIQQHEKIEHVLFQFRQDGHSGFASINTYSTVIQCSNPTPCINSFTVTSVRDEETIDQRNLMTLIEVTEGSQDECYSQQDLDELESKKNNLLEEWTTIESRLLKKYHYISLLDGLKHLEIGFCYSWTPQVWNKCLGKYAKASTIKELSLHGWDQLGKIGRFAGNSIIMEPIRIEAETAIMDCLCEMHQLKSLQLVDFSIGPGLIKAAHSLCGQIDDIDIIYSQSFSKYLTDPEDIWMIFGPLKDFLITLFPQPEKMKSNVTLHLHSSIVMALHNISWFDPLDINIEQL